MPQEPYKSEQQGKKKIGVSRLVVLHVFRHIVYCACARFVKEFYAGYPVAVHGSAVALDIVLPSAEVPHEVSEIHESELVPEHVSEVLSKSGNAKGGALAALGISDLYRFAAGAHIPLI